MSDTSITTEETAAPDLFDPVIRADLDHRIEDRLAFSSHSQASIYIRVMLAQLGSGQYRDCPYAIREFNSQPEWEINLVVAAPAHPGLTYTVRIDRHMHANALFNHINASMPEILRNVPIIDPDDDDRPEPPSSDQGSVRVYKGGWQSQAQVEEFIAKADKDYFDTAERCDMALVYGLVGSEFGEEHALVMAYQPPGFIGRTRSLPPYRVVLKEIPSSTHQLLVIYNAMKAMYEIGQEVGRDNTIAKLTSNIAKLM